MLLLGNSLQRLRPSKRSTPINLMPSGKTSKMYCPSIGCFWAWEDMAWSPYYWGWVFIIATVSYRGLTIMECPNCHHWNEVNARFCEECGFELIAVSSAEASPMAVVANEKEESSPDPAMIPDPLPQSLV